MRITVGQLRCILAESQEHTSVPTMLYHATPGKNASQIKLQGIIARKSKGFVDYEPRIYAADSMEVALDALEWRHGDRETGEVFIIHTDRLPTSVKWFDDLESGSPPNGAYWTNSNIPPDAIEQVVFD